MSPCEANCYAAKEFFTIYGPEGSFEEQVLKVAIRMTWIRTALMVEFCKYMTPYNIVSHGS